MGFLSNAMNESGQTEYEEFKGDGIFRAVPKGDYNVEIIECEDKVLPSGLKVIKLQLKVTDGKFANRRLFFDWIYEHPTSKACTRIGVNKTLGLCAACGIDPESAGTDDFVGKELPVKIAKKFDQDAFDANEDAIRNGAPQKDWPIRYVHSNQVDDEGNYNEFVSAVVTGDEKPAKKAEPKKPAAKKEPKEKAPVVQDVVDDDDDDVPF